MSDSRKGLFDWRMSIGNVVTVITVIAGLIAGWYGFDNRLNLVEDHFDTLSRHTNRELSRIETRVVRIENERDDTRDRLTRLEVQLTGVGKTVDRIAAKVGAAGGVP